MYHQKNFYTKKLSHKGQVLYSAGATGQSNSFALRTPPFSADKVLLSANGETPVSPTPFLVRANRPQKNTLAGVFLCGSDRTRTGDLLRDRQSL